jgi:iduronate 2-sulfatase
MKRSSQAQRLVLLGATTLLSLTAASAADVGPSPKPNVVFIIADDVGRTLGCYGDTMAKTPYIDALAKSGVKFTQAYGQGTVCTPSRNSFLSGLSTQKTGIDNDYTKQKAKYPRIRQMQAVFKAAGYYTVGFGKIGHTTAHEDSLGWDVRDVSNGVCKPGDAHRVEPNDLTIDRDTPNVLRLENEQGSIFQRMRFWEFKTTVTGEKKGITNDESRAESFKTFLANRNLADKKPLFAVIGFHGGHDPQQYRKTDYDDATKGKTFTTTDADWSLKNPDLPFPSFNPLGFNFIPWQPTSTVAEENIKRYYAAVHHMDEKVGQVVKALRDNKLESNTFVVFISDNGYNLGFQGQWAKHNLYADVIHLPLIVKSPGITANLPPASERTDNGVVEYLDIFPTLVELTGISTNIRDYQPSDGKPGRSNGGTDLTVIATPAVTKTLTTPEKTAVLETLELDGRSFAKRLKNPSNTTNNNPTPKDAAYVRSPFDSGRVNKMISNKPATSTWLINSDPTLNNPERRAIYTSNYCYVEYKGYDRKELFNLQTDPHCYNNLLGATAFQINTDKGTELATKLNAYFTQPVVMAINETMRPGETLNLTLTATYYDGVISFQAPGLTLIGPITYANGIYTQSATYTPASKVRSFSTKVSAHDNFGTKIASASVTINVTATPPNTINVPPTAPLLVEQIAMVGEVFSISVPAFIDANDDRLTYSVSGLPAGLSFNVNNRVISGNVSTAVSTMITVTATDPSRASTAATFKLEVLTPGPVIYGSAGGLGSPSDLNDGFQSPWVLTKKIQRESDPTNVSATSPTYAHYGTKSLMALLGHTEEIGLAYSTSKTTGFNTNNYEAVSFWINGGQNDGQQVAMAVNRLAGLQTPVTLETLPKNTWKRVTIRLSDLGAENVTDFRAFRFYNRTASGSSQAFFIDDVVLLNRAPPTPSSLLMRSDG